MSTSASNPSSASASTSTSTASSAPLKVLFFGGTGGIGFEVLRQGLLSVKYAAHFQVTVGCRASALKSDDPKKSEKLQQLKALGAALLELDFEQASHSELVSAIRQYDIVVALTSYGTPLEKSLALLSAAKEAGNLKLFVPSEWGSIYDEVDRPTLLDTVNSKLEFTDALKQSGVPYARIITGVLYEYFFGFFGSMDLAGRSLTAPGSLDSRVTVMSELDSAQLTCEALLNYDKPHVRNQSVILGAETLSWREAAAMLEAKTGSQWKTQAKTMEDMERTIAEQKAPPIVGYLERWHLLMAKQKGFVWDPNHPKYFVQQNKKQNPEWQYKLKTVAEYLQGLKI